MAKGKAKTTINENGERIDLKTGQAYVPTPRNRMAVDSLANPATPAKLPPPPVPIATATLDGSLEAMGDAYTRSLEEKRKQTETQKNTSFDDLVGALRDFRGKSELTDTEYKDTGVDSAQTELDDINNQILTERRALKTTQDRLNKNTEGLETGAVQGELRRAERESLSKQADLSVIQMARQGKFDSAKEIADRAVAAKFERQTQEISILQTIYDEYKGLFTTDEQREFEEKQNTRRTNLDTEREKEMIRYKAMIDAQYDTSGGGGSGPDIFGDEDVRQLSQAGLQNADVRTRSIFVNTPTKFREEFIRNGYGNGEVTPEQLLNSLEEWEAIQNEEDVSTPVF